MSKRHSHRIQQSFLPKKSILSERQTLSLSVRLRRGLLACATSPSRRGPVSASGFCGKLLLVFFQLLFVCLFVFVHQAQTFTIYRSLDYHRRVVFALECSVRSSAEPVHTVQCAVHLEKLSHCTVQIASVCGWLSALCTAKLFVVKSKLAISVNGLYSSL